MHNLVNIADFSGTIDRQGCMKEETGGLRTLEWSQLGGQGRASLQVV